MTLQDRGPSTCKRTGAAEARRTGGLRTARLSLGRLGAVAAGIVGLVGAAFLAAYAVPLPARLALAPSTVVTFADGSPAHVFLSPDEKYRIRVRLGEVDPDYLKALVRLEDKRFYGHVGVDPLAVARAALVNLRRGRICSGASTLTMQLVRLLEPRPRTLASKIVEALRAVQLETRLTKESILEAYLQFAPYGRNLEGIAAACYAYFGHGPGELSADEIATLLAVPQRPSQRYPSARNKARLRAARDAIAGRLATYGMMPPGQTADSIRRGETLDLIRRSNVPTGLRPLPRYAPHASRWFQARAPGASHISTTLDRGIQLLAERKMQDIREEMAQKGIQNGSVVIVDHRAAEIRALVGNLDFWDEAHGGQIAGFDTPRSAGSTLKPFIYALALERGIALPAHLVPDTPLTYGSYSPENYDGGFLGLVRLEDALSQSRNVPFVQLLARVGLERFLGTLSSMGVTHLRPEPGHYGLSAAIGALELTPIELAGIYAALAEHGSYRAPSWLRAEPRERAMRMVSSGAAYLTQRALSRRDRPDFPTRRQHSGAPPRIHWKTGTSYGHRDAWAIGSGPRHTAVVWLGNFDNSPSVDLVGAEAAGPILFDLLEALADRSRPHAPSRRPGDLKEIEVCAYSGYLPTRACKNITWALAIRANVPTTTCPYHVLLDVDVETGLALNPTCRGDRAYRTESFTVWPASIRRWLSERQRWLPRPPSLARGCDTGGDGRTPAIVSPPVGQTIVLIPGVESSRQEIPLEAEGQSSGGKLSWFVDGEYLGTAAAAERLWWRPNPGTHELVVMTESGISARRRVEVRSGL